MWRFLPWFKECRLISMTVRESFLAGKDPTAPESCEDLIVIAENFVAVIDGATDKSGWQLGGKFGGRVAAESIALSIEELPLDIDAFEAMKRLNSNLRRVSDFGPEEAPSASVAIYSRTRNEIWRVGDVNWYLPDSDRRGAQGKRIDRVAADMRAAVTLAASADGAPITELLESDPGRDAILPLLKRQHTFRNEVGEWGYGAIDGRSTPVSLVEITSLEDRDRTVILASDGYRNVYSTLDETEVELAAQLLIDPLCVRELRGTKGVKPGNASFDDRAYVRIELG